MPLPVGRKLSIRLSPILGTKARPIADLLLAQPTAWGGQLREETPAVLQAFPKRAFGRVENNDVAKTAVS
jgi:hypothetical protein